MRSGDFFVAVAQFLVYVSRGGVEPHASLRSSLNSGQLRNDIIGASLSLTPLLICNPSGQQEGSESPFRPITPVRARMITEEIFTRHAAVEVQICFFRFIY